MIFIITALYAEAKPFIEYCCLKKDSNVTKFQVFRSEKYILVITGTGPLNAAVGTSFVMTHYHAGDMDMAVNIGICGAVRKQQDERDIFLCHKIIDHATGRDYYPEILVQHPYAESIVETFYMPVNADIGNEAELVDMEAAGIYQAAVKFLPLHHLYFIKVISDFLEPRAITPQKVGNILLPYVGQILSWLENVGNLLKTDSEVLTLPDLDLLHKVQEHLLLSVTMQHQLHQLVCQYKLRTGDQIDFLGDILKQECNSKNEGKIYFARIRQRLME